MVHAGGAGVISGRVIAEVVDEHGRIQSVRVAPSGGGRGVFVPRDRVVTDLTAWDPS
jgi:hypothetical protein